MIKSSWLLNYNELKEHLSNSIRLELSGRFGSCEFVGSWAYESAYEFVYISSYYGVFVPLNDWHLEVQKGYLKDYLEEYLCQRIT